MQKEATYKVLDYYPFGMQMPARSFSGASGYRFGFNGMLKESDIAEGNYTTPFRELDTRLGRWCSIDPLSELFPWESPYVGFANNPIYYNDPSGLAPRKGNLRKKFGRLTKKTLRGRQVRRKKVVTKVWKKIIGDLGKTRYNKTSYHNRINGKLTEIDPGSVHSGSKDERIKYNNTIIHSSFDPNGSLKTRRHSFANKPNILKVRFNFTRVSDNQDLDIIFKGLLFKKRLFTSRGDDSKFSVTVRNRRQYTLIQSRLNKKGSDASTSSDVTGDDGSTIEAVTVESPISITYNIEVLKKQIRWK